MSKNEDKDESNTPVVYDTFKTYSVIHKINRKTYSANMFKESEEYKGAKIFVAFPNIGITPVLTANFLVQDHNLELIGTIRAKDTPPVSVINSNGQPGPAIRIYGSKELIIITSEMKAEGNMKHLVDTIIDVIKYMESKLVWCVEGVGVEKVDKINREKLRYITCNEELANQLLDLGHTPFHNAMLAGITGGIIAEVAVSGSIDVDVICLLVPSCSLYPDAMSSVVAIKTMSKIEKWTSNPEELEKSAKEVETKVQDMLGSSLRKSGSGWSSMYQ